MKRNRVDFKPEKPEDNVVVPVSLVDRSRDDPQNILGVIVHRDVDTEINKTAVQAGVLNGGCSRNQFDLCPPKLLIDDQN